MSTHSVSDAKNKLPELIDRALNGEDVVITRHGHPVVEIKAIRPRAKPITDADLDWLARNRIPRLSKATNSGELVSKMRDEDWR
jgi:prevent-host-death family protein